MEENKQEQEQVQRKPNRAEQRNLQKRLTHVTSLIAQRNNVAKMRKQSREMRKAHKKPSNFEA